VEAFDEADPAARVDAPDEQRVALQARRGRTPSWATGFGQVLPSRRGVEGAGGGQRFFERGSFAFRRLHRAMQSTDDEHGLSDRYDRRSATRGVRVLEGCLD